MCEIFFDFIKPNQHILTSKQSEMGKKYKAYNILKKSAIKKNFKKYILENNYNLDTSKLYEIICSKSKILKKVNYKKKKD